MYGSLFPVTIPLPPPATPGTSPALRAQGVGVGILLEMVLLREYRDRANRKSFMQKNSSSMNTMMADQVKQTGYFAGKSIEFVLHWLEKNNTSK